MDRSPFDPAPRRRRLAFMKTPWFIMLMAVVVLGLVLAFSINKIMIAILHSRPEVIVPKLEGKGILDALSIVSPVDLSIQQEGTDYDESLPAGTIIRQQPMPGMKVRAGRSIRVVVSKGGQVMFVPVIVGKPLAEAQSILSNNGLQMGSVNEIFSTDAPRGVVIDQRPSSGTIVTRGALIDVDASRGAPPEGAPVVPDFVGKDVDEVQAWANGAGADVDAQEDPKAQGVPGTVVRQDPSPGSMLGGGDRLRVAVVPSKEAGSRLEIPIPDGDDNSAVKVVARDSRGESVVYEGTHRGGTTITIPVTVTSPTRFRIYVNEALRDERLMEPRGGEE